MLSAKRVQALKQPGRYSDGHNLLLQITPSGVKSWLLRFEFDGKERWMGLGPCHTVDLATARELAREARLLLLKGIDPLEQRRADKTARQLEAARSITFQSACEQYFDQHKHSWRSLKHANQFLVSLQQYAYPKIGKLPVAAIDTAAVLSVLDPIWQTKNVTASRVRSRIENVLSWATVRGYRQGDNPAKWSGYLEHSLPSPSKRQVKHHEAMDYQELPAFMSALAAREGIDARAMEYLILTASRTAEVRFARWDEIDFLSAQVWTIPAGRMKAGKEHRVPLSSPAVALLKALPTEKGNPYVFVGRAGQAMGDLVLARLLRTMNIESTVHGLRSSFRVWAAERTNYPREVCEQALAHGTADKVEAAYQRGDLFVKRVQLMEAWAKFCYAPPAAGEVVPIRSA